MKCIRSDQESFSRTYEKVSLGVYRKSAHVFAVAAVEAGQIKTKEGVTHYLPGDYLVSNNADGTDAYAMDAAKFVEMYEPAE